MATAAVPAVSRPTWSLVATGRLGCRVTHVQWSAAARLRAGGLLVLWPGLQKAAWLAMAERRGA
ncbi:MAG TPA: hypothetical protein VIS78_06385 [Blastocatellia bacterium]